MSNIILLVGLGVALLNTWNVYGSIRTREFLQQNEKDKEKDKVNFCLSFIKISDEVIT